MSALGMIAYLFGCFVIGAILTLIVSIFRSVKNHDNFRSWRYMVVFGLLVSFAPYVYAESLTKMNGAGMEKAVERTVKQAKIKGEAKFFRVTKVDESRAEIIIVAKEKTTTNDAESCVLRAELEKKKGKWVPKSYEFIDSFDRGKDGMTFPPYW